MHLTLLRHAKATDREEWSESDADRPLTKAGIEQARRVLVATAPLITASEIWSSPWLRARQTGELASSVWELPLREMPWLAGEALQPAERAARLERRTDTVLVGHEPDLGDLARFLCGARLDLKKCGLVLLVGDPVSGGMTLRGLWSPKMVLGLDG
ncbi:MAG: histidine phosphatase family protein [Planctomycetes bacterium]|nr:histidine phosphatase family protein [Planctomycetota bacterium]